MIIKREKGTTRDAADTCKRDLRGCASEKGEAAFHNFEKGLEFAPAEESATSGVNAKKTSTF